MTEYSAEDLLLLEDIEDHDFGNLRVYPPTPEDRTQELAASVSLYAQGPEAASAKVKFRGGYTCTCVATSLPWVELFMIDRGIIKSSIDIYQLGYRDDVSASAGTHAAGGNTDVGQFSDDAIEIWRLWGWTIQHRTTRQGFDMDHGHGWPWGCTHLSSGGKAQAEQWKDRENGLISHGRVVGRWPVGNWKDEMERMWFELFTTADITKDVVGRDNMVSNAGGQFTGNPANPGVSVKTALEAIVQKSNRQDAAITALQKTVAADSARLAAVQTQQKIDAANIARLTAAQTAVQANLAKITAAQAAVQAQQKLDSANLAKILSLVTPVTPPPVA